MVRRHQMISDNDITALLSTRIIGTIPYDKSVIIARTEEYLSVRPKAGLLLYLPIYPVR